MLDMKTMTLRIAKGIPEEDSGNLALLLGLVSSGALAIVPDEKGEENLPQPEAENQGAKSFLLINREGNMVGALLLFASELKDLKAMAVGTGETNRGAVHGDTSNMSDLIRGALESLNKQSLPS